MLDFLTLGKKYKKNFTVQFNSDFFNMKLYSQIASKYILDYHDGNFENIETNQNGYLQINKNTCVSKKISLAYNNYHINGLYLCKNQVKKIVLQELRHLCYLNVSDNEIQHIVVSKCVQLQSLIVNNNFLTQLDLSKNKNLKYLDVSSNQIAQLNFSNNNKILQISANNNLLQDIKVPCSVQRLNVSNNKLKSISFSPLSQLRYLNIENNSDIEMLYINSRNIQFICCKNTKITKDKIFYLHKDVNPTVVF